MRALAAIACTARRVRLTAVGCLMTLLACVALSACTGTGTGTSTPSASVSILSPSAGGSAVTNAAGGGSPDTGSPSPSPSPSPSGSPTPSPSFSPIPTAAPVTGGGGTAGFQDAGIAVLGGTAILAGLGSIAYRRKITRNR